MIKMAVDVGFGRVKALASNGRRIGFPSVIGDFNPVQFVLGMASDLISQLVVDYAGKQHFVGESALKQSTPQATVDKERTVSEEGTTLLAAAMTLLTEEQTEAIKLVVGLPVMHYDTLKQRYLQATKTIHQIDLLSLTGQILSRKYLPVLDVKVLPQPFGTFFDRLLDEKGEIRDPALAEGKVGIVDIGYNTLDLARVDSLEFINPRSTSFSGLGLFTSFQVLSGGIYREFGVEIPPERLEPVVRSGELRVGGKVVSIEHLKQQAFREAANQIISRIKSVWPDRWELDRVIISGGGAIGLGEYLRSELKQEVQIVEEPVYANASGYLKFAERVWGL